MKRTDHYTSRWLKAADLSPEGDNLTITQFITEKVGQSEEPKPVMSFAELEKDWILNKRQWDAVWELLGDDTDTDAWIGKRIKLVPIKVETKDGLKNTIRIESADPPKKQTLSRRTPKPTPVGIQVDDNGESIPF
jgi:hypothetical protein